jgi:hypothetical protein
MTFAVLCTQQRCARVFGHTSSIDRPAAHRRRWGARPLEGRCLQTAAQSRLNPSFELLVQSLGRIGRARAAPLAQPQASEGEQTVAGFLMAVGDSAVLEPPLADEGLAAGFDLLPRRRIDHFTLVGGNLLVQAATARSQVARSDDVTRYRPSCVAHKSSNDRPGGSRIAQEMGSPLNWDSANSLMNLLEN